MKNQKINLFRTHRNHVWLAIYMIYLAVLTLSPFQFSLFRFRQSYPEDPIEFIKLFVYFRDYDMIMNGLLFLPLGILIYRLSCSKDKMTLFGAFFTGAIVSLGIECIQFFLDRSPNGIDILINAAGTGLGFILARFHARKEKPNYRFYQKLKNFAWPMMSLIYGLCIVVLFLFPLKLTTPDSWNLHYPLLIGNERSMDRPWLGDIRLAALYKRAVSSDQASLLSVCNPDSVNIPLRRQMGLIALYPFDEIEGDTIHDRSGYGEPLNLTGDSIVWLQDGGIRTHGGIIQSVEPGSKITKAVQKSRALSVEVWCRPSSLVQEGPARIVSFSKNVLKRNFALVQQGKGIHLRLRSHMGGENGNRICLRARNVLNHDRFYHLVATYDHGVEQLFVDGKRHKDIIFGHISYLSEILGLGTGTIGQFCSVIAIFFPLGVLVAFSVTRCRMFATFFFTCITALAADLFYVFSYGAPVCTVLWWLAVLSALLATILYRIIH
jgi:glycopeptide antibiotics resistance protein